MKASLIPRWFAAMIAASLLIIGYGLTRGPATEGGQPAETTAAPVAQSELLDVMWLDKYPQLATDPWKAYIFTNENVGLNIDAHSAYKLTIELFEFKYDSRNLSFHFPHDSRKLPNVPYKIEKMKKPTRHFDTQLTIERDPQRGNQPAVYFTGPEFRSGSTLPELLQEALRSNGLFKYLPESTDSE